MNEKGLTLIEVMVSIVVLSIIAVSLFSFFVQSARSNNISKNMIDSTYIAQKNIEEINYLNKTFKPITSDPLAEFKTLMVNNGYPADAYCTNCFGKVQDNHYVRFEIKSSTSDIGKVVVKVLDTSKSKTLAQMELLLSWKK